MVTEIDGFSEMGYLKDQNDGRDNYQLLKTLF